MATLLFVLISQNIVGQIDISDRNNHDTLTVNNIDTCIDEKIVVISIMINPQGYVISAKPLLSKSTITDSTILHKIVEFALKSKFSEKLDAPAKQAGTITYRICNSNAQSIAPKEIGLNNKTDKNRGGDSRLIDSVRISAPVNGYWGSYRYCNGGKCNGLIIDTLENGNIKMETNYVNGKKDGLVCEYYANGQVEYFGYCDTGVYMGEWKSFYENGNIRRVVLHWDCEKVKEVDYYENGQIESKRELSADLNYVLYEYSFNEKGDTLYAFHVIDWETKIYHYIIRYKNGQIEEEGQMHYIDGGFFNIGTWTFYKPNGEIEKKIEY
jgi:antitoxin component YwqK of YwqJK toxin-antitoxin module